MSSDHCIASGDSTQFDFTIIDEVTSLSLSSWQPNATTLDLLVDRIDVLRSPFVTSVFPSSTYGVLTTGRPEISDVTGDLDGGSVSSFPFDAAEQVIDRVVVIIVCALGLLCNVFNLVVLSRKSLTATMERLERSAHYGLIGKYIDK